MDWVAVEQKRVSAPFVPALQHAEDVANFDQEFVQMDPVNSENLNFESHMAGLGGCGPFDGWSYAPDQMQSSMQGSIMQSFNGPHSPEEQK